MPEAHVPANRQIVALAMLISAVTMAVVAYLIGTGLIDLGAEVRTIAAIALGVVAFLDFVVGLWFFRSAQSS